MTPKLMQAYRVLKEEGILYFCHRLIIYLNMDSYFFYLAGIPIRFFGRYSSSFEDLVLFGTYKGRGFEDNSRYVYEWLLKNETKIQPVWVAHSNEVYTQLVDEGKPVVKARSPRGIYLLMRASAGVFTANKSDIAIHRAFIPDSVELFKIQHGTPVKKHAGDKKTIEELRNRRLSVDSIIVTSEFMRDLKFKQISSNQDEFDRLKETYSSKFHITGYPRNDVLYDPSEQMRATWDSFLNDISVEYDSVLLYAPTKHYYRLDVDDKEPATDFFPFDDFEPESLYKELNERNELLLLRPHPADVVAMHERSAEPFNQMKKKLDRLCEGSDRVVMATQNEIQDTNTILAFTDILITDYSSIYHDFLLLDRPMLFVPYDYDDYKEQRGFVYDYYEYLPGPAIDSFADFMHELSVAVETPEKYANERERLRDKVHTYQDSHSSKRVAELIEKQISESLNS